MALTQREWLSKVPASNGMTLHAPPTKILTGEKIAIVLVAPPKFAADRLFIRCWALVREGTQEIYDDARIVLEECADLPFHDARRVAAERAVRDFEEANPGERDSYSKAPTGVLVTQVSTYRPGRKDERERSTWTPGLEAAAFDHPDVRFTLSGPRVDDEEYNIAVEILNGSLRHLWVVVALGGVARVRDCDAAAV